VMEAAAEAPSAARMRTSQGTERACSAAIAYTPAIERLVSHADGLNQYRTGCPRTNRVRTYSLVS
jgi:hypothetical protein